jgi:hypothetical protein
MDKGLWEAACSVRRYLDEMLGPVLAADVDAQLAGLLDHAAGGQDVEEPLQALLEQHQATSVYLERVLDDAPDFRPPQVVSATTPMKGYSGLPGHDVVVVGADKFRCPCGDYVWYRMELGARIPRCPTPAHDSPLEIVQSG